jgi:hypothetical protein
MRGSIPLIAGFVAVWPSRIERLRDFSCVVVVALKCWSVVAATGARCTVPKAVRRPSGGERNVKSAGTIKRDRRSRPAHAARGRRYRARQKNVTHQGSPSQAADDVVSPDATVAARQSHLPCVPRRTACHCHWCGCCCSQFVRQRFLRRRRVLRSVTHHDRKGAHRGHPPDLEAQILR